MTVSRRSFLTGSSMLGASLFIPRSFNAFAASQFKHNLAQISPITMLNSFQASTTITGDTPDEAHEIFWNKTGFITKKGGLPRANESYDVIIVGSGIAGLTAAFQLVKENKKVLILEGHPRLGGNAKAERYKNTYMGLGSAYVTLPEEGDGLDRFYKEIGVHNHFKRVGHGEESIAVNGKIYPNFWKGGTDPRNKDQLESNYKKLNEVYEEYYPDLPWVPGGDIDRANLDRLDSIKFSDWVKAEMPDIHPHVLEYFHQYCWSSFAAGYDQVSAAQALNFITSDLQGIQALPGGNAFIAKALLEKIKDGAITIKNNAFCVDIREDGNGVYVCYHEDNKVLRAAQGKKVIVSLPKMVAKFVIDDLPSDQHKAMDDIVYHAYLVANVVLKKNIKAPAYDIYSLRNEIPTHEYEDSKKRVFTDITFANWANANQAENQALTLYMPLPYAMAQQLLFSPILYEKYDGRVREALTPFMNELNLNWSDVDGIRLTRYGHALPVAMTKAISSGQLERAHRPINNRIFFANQDNWANPCVETSFYAASVAAYQVLGKEFDF